MKTNLTIPFLLLVFITAYSQNPGGNYWGRYTPVVKMEKLSSARQIAEIMPEFTRYFELPFSDRVEMDYLLKAADSPRGCRIYPLESFSPSENYTRIIDLVSVTITAACNGKILTGESTGASLSKAQKSILSGVDPGSVLSISVRFKYKGQPGTASIKEGTYRLTAVPETEAEYPGGLSKIAEYLEKRVSEKMPGTATREKLQRVILKFTVNGEGQIAEAQITRTSADAKMDRLLLEAIRDTKVWKPAQNGKGVKISQQFSFQYGGGC